MTSSEYNVFHIGDTTLRTLEALPPDIRSKFVDYLINYFLYGTIPETKGLEKDAWLQLKNQIDEKNKKGGKG
jgi:hypothetical protein